MLHRAAVDVDAAQAFGHGQPQAAAIIADPQQPGLFAIDRTQSGGQAAERMHAGADRQVGLVTIAETQAQFAHRAAI